MSKPAKSETGQWHSLVRFGEMVYAKQPAEALQEELRRLLSDSGAAAPRPFSLLYESLSLTGPEACCVALNQYIESTMLPQPTPRELRKYYRRAGGGQNDRLSRLFDFSDGKALLRPAITAFLAELVPALPPGGEIRLTWNEDGPNLHGKEPLASMQRFVSRVLKEPPPISAAVILEGATGSGRRFLFGKLAEEMGCGLLSLPAAAAAQPSVWEEMLLTAALYNALICLEGAEGLNLEELARQAGLLLLAADEGARLAPTERCMLLRLRVAPVGGVSLLAYLRTLPDALPPDDQLPRKLTERLSNLPVGTAIAVARQAQAQSWAGGAVSKSTFEQLLRQCGAPPAPGTDLLDSEYLLEDLVLAERQKVQLRRICAFAKAREQVFHSWGFGSKAPWGQGITALFYGPPGTGKTMAASAVANELGQPLYRVDLSQLISKYIGETQKNIGLVFDRVQRNGGILFFDEADALFSRRSEAGDSQDKYANAEIAYLLQRTEGHTGLCILATNLLQNFDEAFRRRIHYMIAFPLPDAEQRLRIWRTIFPAQAPVDGLEEELLAGELELSGAAIKNCVVHAACRAACANSAITMAMVLDGAREEYAKLGKQLPPLLARRLEQLEEEELQ